MQFNDAKNLVDTKEYEEPELNSTEASTKLA